MVTPHIAGSKGSEIGRLTDSALDELSRWIADKPLWAEITPKALTLHA
jgi:phosphoglycerate dehydrogenase-like enzyme